MISSEILSVIQMFSIYESTCVIEYIAFFVHMELAYQPVLIRIHQIGGTGEYGSKHYSPTEKENIEEAFNPSTPLPAYIGGEKTLNVVVNVSHLLNPGVLL